MNTHATRRLSVVVPTFDRREELRATLSALASQTLASSDYEIVVVVDGSTDGTTEMLTELRLACPLIVAVQPKRGGRAAACNEGARRARGAVLVLLDDDITASARLLEEHATYVGDHPRHAVVGAAPISLTDDSPAVVRLVGEKMNAHLAHLAQPGYRFRERDFYSGNFAIDRSLFFEAGGFDEDFTLYGNEDCELARRLLLRGVPIIYHAAALGHQRYAKTFAQLARDTYEKGRTRVLLSRKHPAIASALGVTAAPRLSWKGLLLLALLRLVRGRKPRPAPPLVGLVAGLDRRWPRRLARRYRAILDVYFWLGVTDERRSPRSAAA
jgi:GT2 family glycosyltransferase